MTLTSWGESGADRSGSRVVIESLRRAQHPRGARAPGWNHVLRAPGLHASRRLHETRRQHHGNDTSVLGDVDATIGSHVLEQAAEVVLGVAGRNSSSHIVQNSQ